MPRGVKQHAGRTKPPGIREIAESLGLSIGTVDRALHNRPGINGETRRRILQRAEALGYRPNLAARFLSSQKQLRIGVNLPREIASFFDLVKEGILAAVRSVETSHVRVIHRSYPGLGDGEEDALAEALADDLHGLIMVPGQPAALAPLLKQAAERGLPVVCVNTDAPEVEHLVTVSVDSLTTGLLAGELMGRFLAGKGRVMVVTGQLGTIDHAQKVAGFRRALAEMWPDLRLERRRGARPRTGGLREEPAGADLDARHRRCLREHRQLHPGAEGDRGRGSGRPRHRHHLGPLPGPRSVHRVGTGRRHPVPAPFHAGPARIPGALQVPRRRRPAPPGDPDGSPHRDEGQPEALHGPPARTRPRAIPAVASPKAASPRARRARSPSRGGSATWTETSGSTIRGVGALRESVRTRVAIRGTERREA